MKTIVPISFISFVIPAGFEPTTHSLEGCCSIQLSYETNSIMSLLKRINFQKRCKSSVFFAKLQP